MIKFTQFDTADANGEYIKIINKDYLEKTAEYTPELKEYISKLQPKEGKTFVLVNAMGAGEYYSSNRNGDYFPENQLQKYHKTFEKEGYAYRHHINKDQTKASGRVVFATYHPTMHRVELVIELDNAQADDIIHKITNGEFPPVSMGTRTPSDCCSICGHRAKRVADYCDHLKYEMNRIYPDGRKVYAKNDDRLTFFDISFVRIGADKIAFTIMKLASEVEVIPSAIIGEEFLKEAGIKESTLFKDVDGSIEAMSDDPQKLIFNSQHPMPREFVRDVMAKYAFEDILSTMLGMHMMPLPSDFQYMALTKMGKQTLADYCDQHAISLMNMDEPPTFPANLKLNMFNEKIAHELEPMVPNMSFTKPLILTRVMIKRAEDVGIIPPSMPAFKIDTPTISTKLLSSPIIPMAGLGSLYIAYQKLMNGLGVSSALADAGRFEQMLLRRPWLIPILLGVAAVGTMAVSEHMLKQSAVYEPHFLTRMLVGVPSSYVYSGYAENKLRKGEELNKFENLVRKYPFLTGMMATVGMGQVHKLYKSPGIYKMGSLDGYIYGLGPEQFEKLYADVVGLDNN